MGLFGSTQTVRILGPLLLAGQPVACPEKGCGDTGKGGKGSGHTLTAAGEKGLATITCGANPQHQWQLPELSIAAVKQLPRKGRFDLRHGDAVLAGIAARPGTGEKKQAPAGPPQRALTQQAAAATPRGGGSSGPVLAAVLVAGLGTATAGLNAVGQVARTGSEIAKAGNNAIGLARDGAQTAGRALDGRIAEGADTRRKAEADARRAHEQIVLGVKTKEAAAARRHEKALGQQRNTPKRAL